MTDVSSTSYFDLFKIPTSYDVDLNILQHRYRELQKRVHPDKYASGSSQERRVSMQQTSLINQALHTLKHPVERAVYLLQLKQPNFTMGNQTTMDAAFLMEQMEMREKLHVVRDLEDPIAELETMLTDVQSKLEHYAAEFSLAYDVDAFDNAKEAVRKLQFLYKAKTEIDELITQVEDELM
ncbi:MAG: Fe-S protein assembly co-chaperone HscB [Gammaproteobacteria bacterium]|nr:Fe-S protein assembly co-chaperone HscB [Gammaproteobacteria bacterium]NNJ96371.1 Fe-S protein assembly co-chaperone HscB [Gammaproteobacteria bacterium]